MTLSLIFENQKMRLEFLIPHPVGSTLTSLSVLQTGTFIPKINLELHSQKRSLKVYNMFLFHKYLRGRLSLSFSPLGFTNMQPRKSFVLEYLNPFVFRRGMTAACRIRSLVERLRRSREDLRLFFLRSASHNPMAISYRRQSIHN